MFTPNLEDYTTLSARLTAKPTPVDAKQDQTAIYDLHLPTNQCDPLLTIALIDAVKSDGHPVQILPGIAIIQSLTPTDLNEIQQYIQVIWKQKLLLDTEPSTAGGASA